MCSGALLSREQRSDAHPFALRQFFRLSIERARMTAGLGRRLRLTPHDDAHSSNARRHDRRCVWPTSTTHLSKKSTRCFARAPAFSYSDRAGECHRLRWTLTSTDAPATFVGVFVPSEPRSADPLVPPSPPGDESVRIRRPATETAFPLASQTAFRSRGPRYLPSTGSQQTRGLLTRHNP